MNPTRKQISDKIKYLRRVWTDTLMSAYPQAAPVIYNSFKEFLNLVQRENYVQESVKCSNGQDIEQLRVNEVDKSTLLSFVQNLPENCYITVEAHEDYDGYFEYLMQAWYYRNETDQEYLQRISELHNKIENKQQKKRCADPEVNQYIEYLEKQLVDKE